MESKTKSESYYNALFEDPKRANKILIEILEEDEKKYGKNKVEKNGIEKK